VGKKISAAQAAKLVGRHERIIRGWIMSGLLHAEKNPETLKWEIDTDNLQQVHRVTEEERIRIQRWAEDRQTDQFNSQETYSASSISGQQNDIYLPSGLQTRLENLERSNQSLWSQLDNERQEIIRLTSRLTEMEHMIERLIKRTSFFESEQHHS
jgi:aromatic ring hydroxylase